MTVQPSPFIRVENQPPDDNHPSTDPVYILGSSSSYAYDWSRGTTGGIRTQGRHFVDGYAACVIFVVSTSRGIAKGAFGLETHFAGGV